MNHKEYCKQYYQLNKDKAKERNAKRYALRKDELNKELREKRKRERARYRLYERKAKAKWRAKNKLRETALNTIRRKTWRLFPITNNNCEICKVNKAEEHHHNTIPYRYDKFLFVCKDCHRSEDSKLFGGIHAHMER